MKVYVVNLIEDDEFLLIGVFADEEKIKPAVLDYCATQKLEVWFFDGITEKLKTLPNGHNGHCITVQCVPMDCYVRIEVTTL